MQNHNGKKQNAFSIIYQNVVNAKCSYTPDTITLKSSKDDFVIREDCER